MVRESLSRSCLRCVSISSVCFKSKLIYERPAHAYTFSFEPNPDWSSFYAYGPEIKQYMQAFAQNHDLMPYIELNSKVLKAEWIEEKGICKFFMVDICAKQYANFMRLKTKSKLM
jgi:hypothetical protein